MQWKSNGNGLAATVIDHIKINRNDCDKVASEGNCHNRD